MSTYRKPNILIFIVDQMREPQWFPNQATLDQLLPNLAKLRQNAVRFTRHLSRHSMKIAISPFTSSVVVLPREN
jgi:arylsulfatase A-like enzyme